MKYRLTVYLDGGELSSHPMASYQQAMDFSASLDMEALKPTYSVQCECEYHGWGMVAWDNETCNECAVDLSRLTLDKFAEAIRTINAIAGYKYTTPSLGTVQRVKELKHEAINLIGEAMYHILANTML